MIKCKECGNRISESANSCPKCGATRNPPPRFGFIFGVVLVVCFLLFMFMPFRAYSVQAADSPYHIQIKANHHQVGNAVPIGDEAPEVVMHRFFERNKTIFANGDSLQFSVWYRDSFTAHYDKYSCVMDGEIILVINQTNCYEFKDK